jgi:hypothetical protein
MAMSCTSESSHHYDGYMLCIDRKIPRRDELSNGTGVKSSNCVWTGGRCTIGAGISGLKHQNDHLASMKGCDRRYIAMDVKVLSTPRCMALCLGFASFGQTSLRTLVPPPRCSPGTGAPAARNCLITQTRRPLDMYKPPNFSNIAAS